MSVAPSPLHEHRRGYPLWPAVVLFVVIAAIDVALLAHEGVLGGSSAPAGLQGSGVAAAQSREVAAFDSVELAGSNVVTIRVGARRAVVVHADDNLLSRVTTRVRSGRLVVGNLPGSFTAKSEMRVDAVTPSLVGLALEGSGVITATGIDAPSFTVTLDGSGVVRANGRTDRLQVAVPGSGDAQLEQLIARHVQATIAGSGRILVAPTASLDASVPGSGAVVYAGSPTRVTVDVTGSGTVTHG